MSTVNTQTPEVRTTIFTLERTQLVFNLLIAAAWLWLYWPLTDYLGIIFSREDFRTNQIILAGVVILIALQVHKTGLQLHLEAPPQYRPLPLALALGGSALYLLVERFLDVNTLAASLFAVASYGLLGLWLAPGRWRQGLPAALLLIGTLPFGAHLQTFVGYPMRIVTAALVRDGLAAAGVTAVGIDTILVFENGISQVDLPCSGVQSLWTGALFLLAATWIERRPLNRRWLATAFLFASLLFIANLARVAVLVTVGEVMGWHLAAEMLHVPLGVLGFAAACAAAVWLLRTAGEIRDWRPVLSEGPESTLSPRREEGLEIPVAQSPISNLQSLLLVAVIAVMALLYTPRPQTGLTQAPPGWDFPAGLSVEPLPLKPDEYEWLTREGAESADRLRFEWRGLSGSMILITSRTWRAHHRPERCFEVYGLSLDDSRTHLVTPTLPVRLVALGDGDRRALLSAGYWFQAAGRTTDDYATRIWADLAPRRQRWVLVSVLFDSVVDPHDEDVQLFYLALHDAVAGGLSDGTSDIPQPPFRRLR